MTTEQNKFKTTGISIPTKEDFSDLECKEESTKSPNAEDATAFWKGIWSTIVEHK